MKKIMKKLACAALTAALVITSLAVAPDTQAAPKTKKIVMNKKSVKLAVGEKYKLKVKKVKPAKASKKVTYKTTKKSVATVTKKGVIKAKAVGTAKIKVTSKVNKKAKATVKVTVTTPSVVSPSAQPTTPVQNVTPNPTATAPVDTATDVPAATDTPKPTRTPRPTAVPTTPTPEPTPPPMKDPGAPYELPFVLDGDTPNIVPQGDATVEANGDGSVKVTVNTQYSGMAFNVPTEMLENNYDTMTVYYKDPVNVSTGFGCGLWQDPNNKDTETVAAWGGVFSAADEEGNILQEGEYTAALGEGNTKTWYINKALFFFNDADSLSTNGPAQVTITKVVFSNSKYTGGDEPEPTPGSEATASPEPSAEPPVAVKMADDAVVTVDGIADEAAYADVAAYDIASRVVCDNKKDSNTTATAKLMWKADALYGFVSVKDADIAKFGNNNYQWDGIELFLDEDNSRNTEWANNTDAFQYRYTGYTKTEEGVANPAAAAIFAGGNSTDYAVEAQYVFTEDGYDVEFKIPFKDAKEIDSVIGFDIIVQDCDSEGRNAEIYMFPTDKTKSYWNLADVFGELTLKDAKAEPPAPAYGFNADKSEYKVELTDDVVWVNENMTKTNNGDGTYTIEATGASGPEFGLSFPTEAWSEDDFRQVKIEYSAEFSGPFNHTRHYGSNQVGWMPDEDSAWSAPEGLAAGDGVMTVNATADKIVDGKYFGAVRFFNVAADTKITIKSVTLTAKEAH